MIVFILFLLYITIAGITVGVLNVISNCNNEFDKECIIIIGFLWPVSIIGVIVIFIVGITEEITKKFLK